MLVNSCEQLFTVFCCSCWLLVSVTVSIAAGLLVMVSSELVVLLIVCVGINTGSAQGELTKVAKKPWSNMDTYTNFLPYRILSRC